MTWAEAKVALQLEAEERIGEVLRYRARREQAIEDAQMKEAMESLSVPRR